MKKTILITGLSVALLFIQCATQTKIEYNIPENETPQQKEVIKARLDKGLNLYKLNCAGCHGIFKKGKDGIPNFTAKQINSYKARHVLHDTPNHAFARQIPQEDLDVILYFLLLRKVPKPEIEQKTSTVDSARAK